MHRISLSAFCCIAALCLSTQKMSGIEVCDGTLGSSDPLVVSKGHHHEKKEVPPGKLAAYGKAVLIVQSDSSVNIGPVDNENPFAVVPLELSSSKNKNFTFDPTTNALVAEVSGIYLAEFSLGLSTNKPDSSYGEDVAVALCRTRGPESVFLATTNLGIVVSQDSIDGRAVAFGTHHELLRLCKGDEVQLVMASLPFGTVWQFTGDLNSFDEVASLILIRVGADD